MIRAVTKWLAAATILTAAYATAAPPPAGGEDYKLTEPYSDFFRTLHDAQGELCCTLADCRPVEARPTADGSGWEFLADPKHFKNADGSWIKVPDDRILRGRPNPVGVPIACYEVGFPPFCFLPVSAV
jgi:hypothetical protein